MRTLSLLLACAFGSLGLSATRAHAGSLTLEACLREVMERNPDIARARTELERAEGTRLVIRSRALPRLRLEGNLGYQTDRGPGRAAKAILIGYGTLGQSLFDAGLPASLRRGNLEPLIVRQNFYQVASERLHLARVQFHYLQFYRALQSLQREIAGRVDGNVRVQTDLERAGLAGRRGTVQAQVQRLNIERNIAVFSGESARQTAALRQSMGRSPGNDDPDPIALADLPAIAFEASAAAREALSSRPDLTALHYAIQAGAEDKRIVEAGYFPLVEVRLGGTLVPPSGGGSSNPNALRSIDLNNVNEFRYGVFLAWQVIDTGAVRGQSRNVAAGRAGQEIALARAEADIPRDLARIRAQATSIAARSAAYADAELAASGTFDAVNEQLRAGRASQLEFLNAQENLLEARQGRLQVCLDSALALAELDRITGRYLRFSRATAAK